MRRATLWPLALFTSVAAAAEGLCPEWSEPATVGSFDVARLPELSGLAVASDGSRLFVINDGSRSEFHVAEAEAGLRQTVAVRGFTPRDLEDLAVGICPAGRCLYLADIGDNAARRRSVQIAMIAEAPRFGAEVEPSAVITARYSDGPRDAEAIAVDADGDLWLVTKSSPGRLAPARIYRLTAAQLAAEGVQTFTAAGEIPLDVLGTGSPTRRRTVTAMDIAPDDGRFVLLTYEAVSEFAFRLGDGLPAADAWQTGTTHRILPIAPLVQAEAIAYAAGGRSLLYTTESIQGSPAPLIRHDCR